MEPGKVCIAPSILAADFTRLGDEIRRVEDAGADLVHLDVMDGHFVPNISFGIPVVEAVRRVTSLPLDTHLMISHPRRYLAAFRDAGADSVTIHIEVCPDPTDIMDDCRTLGMECGLVANPETPIESLFPYARQASMILIMSVQPGFGGQTFQSASLERIRQMRRWLDRAGSEAPVQVDGGINLDTAPKAVAAGAGVLVAGSAVFGAPDPAAVIRSLRC